MRTERGPRALVTGAGGLIGHHLMTSLKRRGYWVRGVDLQLRECTQIDADEFEVRDLPRFDKCLLATRGIDHVYALAADIGGTGFISANHATILHNNALINIHTLEAARMNGASRCEFSSSACGYPERLQSDAAAVPLREDDAYPANPQDAYGWEKLMAERVCLATPRNTVSRRVSRDFTTSTARRAPTTADARRCVASAGTSASSRGRRWTHEQRPDAASYHH